MNDTDWILRTSEQSWRSHRQRKEKRCRAEKWFHTAYLTDTPLGPDGDPWTYLDTQPRENYDAITPETTKAIEKTTIPIITDHDDTNPADATPDEPTVLLEAIRDHQRQSRELSEKLDAYRVDTPPLESKHGKLIRTHLVESQPEQTYSPQSPRSSPRSATPSSTHTAPAKVTKSQTLTDDLPRRNTPVWARQEYNRD